MKLLEILLATLSFNMYKIAHTLLWKNCILCFETVLGMNKITPTPSSPPKNKIISKFFYYFNEIYKKIILKGVGLATLSFNRYNMAHGLLGRSCLQSLNIIKKLLLPLPPP